MPRGTRNITEAVKAVSELRAALTQVVADIAKEKAAANKAAAETPKTQPA